MTASLRRLQKELSSNKDESIKLRLKDDDIRVWSGTIVGPPSSYYEGFEYDLLINVPMEYPLVPPSIKFVTKIFHPNVLYEVYSTNF